MASVARPGSKLILGLALGATVAPSLADLGALAARCEEGRLDFILAGPVARVWDPLTLVAALIPTTRKIGLAAAVSTDWAPFNVARALSALDLLSDGRAAWLATPGDAPAADPGRFEEHLETTFALLDSWEDEALVFDKADCVFVERDKVHRITHDGPWFTVDGPLNSPRPVQGRPVVIQAIADESPVTQADVALAPPADLAGSVARLRRLAPKRMLIDLPFSLVPASGASFIGPSGYAGPPDGMASEMARWLVERGCDGFVLFPSSRQDFEDFIRAVVPRLQAMGFVNLDYGDGDLRTRLGLARPPSRFARAATS